MLFHSASASSVYAVTDLAYLIAGRQAAQSKAYLFVQDSRFLSVVETGKVQANFCCVAQQNKAVWATES